MSFNPLWRFPENYDYAPRNFVIGQAARGSSGNTHTISGQPSSVIVESNEPPVYGNYFRIPAISIASPTGHFGGGEPIGPDGLTTMEWVQQRGQFMVTNVDSKFYNVGLIDMWHDLSDYVLVSLSYAGGGYAPYDIRVRDKVTGDIVAIGTFYLDAP